MFRLMSNKAEVNTYTSEKIIFAQLLCFFTNTKSIQRDDI